MWLVIFFLMLFAGLMGPVAVHADEVVRTCPDGNTQPLTVNAFGMGSEIFYKVDVEGQIAPTLGLEGRYIRFPYQNLYHGGTLVKEGEVYRWTNDNEITWRMGLDTEQWTLTDLDGPYAGELRPLSFNTSVCAEYLNSALIQSIAYLSGESQLSQEALAELITGISVEFGLLGADDWPALRESVYDYVSTFDAQYGALFIAPELVNPQAFSPQAQIQFILKQALFDQAFQGDFAESDLITVPEAAVFPGAVSASAPRVSDAVVQIDGDYSTDPAVLLNDQQTVVRPTGYYAPPGELITVTVPSAAAGDQLKVRIGLYRADMEAGLWESFNRFPRISSLYDIEENTITIANPFGGGIYFEVADGASLGKVTITLDGAVKMPMFSTLDLVGHSDDLGAFNAEIQAWHVPHFEMHSANFSATLPMNEGKLYTDPEAMLALMDRGFSDIRMMAGRPAVPIRPEWLAYDRWVTFFGTAMAASYPIYSNQSSRGTVGEFLDQPSNWSSPVRLMDPDFFDITVDTARSEESRWYIKTLFHEWGHLHNLPTLRFQELESNVHLLASVFFNRTMGADLDKALQFSGFQFFDRNQAALDTMFSPNWQNGDRLSSFTINGVFDNELRYQTRSWARLVEIAGLYDWEAVGAIHEAFYNLGRTLGQPVNYGLTDDDFISTASLALNLNLAPIFEFWGVPPSAELAERLKDLTVPVEFEARLLNYRALVPRTQADFEAVYATHAKLHSPSSEVMTRMDYYKNEFDAEMSEVIIDRIDGILVEHYGRVAVDNDLDGFDNDNDAFPDDPSEWLDSDADGIGNNTDTDDDNDGLNDVTEIGLGTDPVVADSDRDSLSDGLEVELGLNPLDPDDCPQQYCPTSSLLLKMIPVLVEKRAAMAE